jgi:hypothetical protein
MAAMPPESKTVFLHVGCRKSGTSALQHGFEVGADALREAGLNQPLLGRGATTSQLVRPLQQAAEAGDPAAARKAVKRLAATIAEDPAPRHLVSLEALAELPAEVTTVVADELADFDLRVVVTARPWALVIPSEWQQRVKGRVAAGYDEYTRAVRDPEDAGWLAAEGAAFHRRQDLADIARRWKAGGADLPVHVVLVPPRREGQPGLVDLFAELVGVEPALLHVPDRNVNPSLGYAEAEILRHVNLALGDRLTNLKGDYRQSVRKWLAQRMMKGSPGSRIRIPKEFEVWAVEASARQVEDLPALGVDVRGDVQSFARPDLPGDDFVRPTDAEILERAAALLADLAVEHERQRKRGSGKGKGRGSAKSGTRAKSRKGGKSGR